MTRCDCCGEFIQRTDEWLEVFSPVDHFVVCVDCHPLLMQDIDAECEALGVTHVDVDLRRFG